MSPIQKNVKVELRTIIDDRGQMEYNQQKQHGTYYQRGPLHVLTFDEKTEDQSIIKNFITIHEHKVTIKRSGPVSMNQQFKRRQLTENVYRHSFGLIRMETFTDQLIYKERQENGGGELTIVYRQKMNGQEERKHKLKLTFSEEDSA